MPDPKNTEDGLPILKKETTVENSEGGLPVFKKKSIQTNVPSISGAGTSELATGNLEQATPFDYLTAPEQTIPNPVQNTPVAPQPKQNGFSWSWEQAQKDLAKQQPTIQSELGTKFNVPQANTENLTATTLSSTGGLPVNPQVTNIMSQTNVGEERELKRRGG